MSSARRTALVLAAALAVGSAAAAAPAAAAPSRLDTVPSHAVHYPTVGAAHASRAAKGLATAASGSGQLSYQGGVSGVGVTTGAPKVYLVFWGSQWGTQGIDANGNATFTGDTKGAAPVLQAMFKGLGTGNESWSGVMTQFCEGVAVGTTTCAAGTAHVGYPTGGALAGVWLDASAAAPSQATDHQIAVEAYSALQHFGNLTAASNRNVQYVVISPTGTHPGGFNTTGANWCAWHDWNGDSTLNGGGVTSAYGDFAFTNLPYISDMNASCGMNYVNAGAAGTLDGWTMVEGHEYAETITDQFPSGGWIDSIGYENADKCAWVGVGGTGGAQNIAFTTGTFAMTGTYSNDGSTCSVSHRTVTNSTNVVAVTAPSAQSTFQGTAATPVTATATDSDPNAATFSWSATGLPAGITIDAATGTMSGTPTTKGTYTVTLGASDTAGAYGSASFTWTITGNTVTVAKPANRTGTKGMAITPFTPTATDSNAAFTTFTWSATGLPAGLAISASTGTITGTPTGTGTSTVTLKATDSTGASGTASFSWTISSTTVTVAVPAAQTTLKSTTISPLAMSATDSNPAITAFTWSASGLPTGLTINASTGVISGKTGTTAKTYTVKVTAKDSNGSTGSATFSWTVK